MKNNPVNPHLIDVKANIRQRLLHVAIRLFAEQGIDAVPMRAINLAAGTKNKSAVHYHFGNKLGIVEAIFQMLEEKITPVFDDLLIRVEKRSETEDLDIAEILITLYLPFFIISNEEGFGRYVIKLFSKMMLDPTPEYQQLFKELFQPFLSRIFVLLQKQLPDKPEQDLKFQLIHSAMATITGIATIDLMDNTPLGDIRFNNDLEMLFSYIDYVTGGLSNEQSCINSIDIEFWQTYLKEITQTT